VCGKRESTVPILSQKSGHNLRHIRKAFHPRGPAGGRCGTRNDGARNAPKIKLADGKEISLSGFIGTCTRRERARPTGGTCGDRYIDPGRAVLPMKHHRDSRTQPGARRPGMVIVGRRTARRLAMNDIVILFLCMILGMLLTGGGAPKVERQRSSERGRSTNERRSSTKDLEARRP
jgi:hypothetical protein